MVSRYSLLPKTLMRYPSSSGTRVPCDSSSPMAYIGKMPIPSPPTTASLRNAKFSELSVGASTTCSRALSSPRVPEALSFWPIGEAHTMACAVRSPSVAGAARPAR
ncbi:hypothetical protein D3C81_1622320 [compost metagenome]